MRFVEFLNENELKGIDVIKIPKGTEKIKY